MADERHIIDIILKARDDTAAAISKATANLKGFEEASKRVGEQQDRSNKAAKKSFADLSAEISLGKAEMDKLTRSLQGSKGITDDTAASVVKLEQATRKHVQAMADENASIADKKAATAAMNKAQSDLNTTITTSTNLNKKQAEALSENVKQYTKQIEQAQRLQKVQADAHRDIVSQIAERKRANSELARILNQSEREAQQRREQELKEILDLEKTRKDAHNAQIRRSNELARIINQSEREAQQRREQENREIQQLEKTKKDAHDAEIRRKNELARILNQSDREAAQRREADLRDINTLTKARDDAAVKLERQRGRELKLGRDYIQQIQQIQRLEQERQRAIESGDFVQKVQLDFDAAKARAEAAEIAAELKTLFGKVSINADLDDSAARAHAVEVIAMKELLGRDITIDVDFDVDAASVARVNALAAAVRTVGDDSKKTGRDVNFLTGLIGSMKEGFDSGSQRIASFDNYLRGLLSLGIAIFFNQLFLLAGAAAGALTALASSALMAGAALAGGLTAGIMQAIPVLGVFATALSRVKQVTEAVQQANLLQQQQSYAGATAARAQASAQDAVVAASERVKDANERVAEAQKKVNEARQEGIDKLQDLIFQERGLSLSVEESDAALRKAAASGDTASLGRAFLRRDESRAQLGRVSGEIDERQAAGAGASPEVQAAKAALDDAVQAGKQAERALEQSKRSASEAAEGVTAAQGKLAFLLAGLSGAERQLYDAIIRLQTVWRNFAKQVSEPLINAFTFAIGRVITILQNPAVRSAFTALSESMAAQFKRIFAAFTSPESIGQILRFVEAARQNLKPLTDIFINIGKAFMDVGEAAGPALTKILGWLDHITGAASEFFAQGRKSGDLTKFFNQGVTHLKAWGDLLWEVIRLFAAIAGPGGGAQTGLALIRDMAETIRGWADAIGDTDSKTNEFFRRFFRLSRQMIEAMAPVFQSIAREIDKTFTKDGLDAVKGFATFLADVLIPAVGDFARFIGRITSRLGEFTREHPQVAQIAASFLAATFAATTLLKALTIFGPITKPIGFIAKHFVNWGVVLERIGKIFAPVVGLLKQFGAQIIRFAPFLTRFGAIGAGPFALIAGALIFVLAKLGLLDDLFRAFGKFFTGLWEQISPPIERAGASFKKLFDRIREGRGAFAALRPVLKAVIDILGFFLEGIGRSIGKVLGGIIDVISGVVEVVVSLLSGDFAGAWEGLKRIVTGAVRAVIGVIELFLLRGMGKLFGSIVRGVVSMGKSFIGALIDVGKAAIPAIMRFLIRLPGRLIGFLKDLVFAVRNGLAGLEVLFRVLGRRIFDRLSNGFVTVFNFFKSLPGKIFDFVKGIPDKVISAFQGIGGAILTAIWGGVGNVADVGKDIANAVIDLLNKGINSIEISILGKDIDPFPDDPIPRFAAGGRVGRGYGGGDRRLIMAEDGEFVVRKEAVRSLGEEFMSRINRGPGGGRGGRFAQGGAVRGGGGIGISFSGDLGDFSENWGDMWGEIADIARRGAAQVNAIFRNLGNRLGVITRRTWEDLLGVTNTQTRRLLRLFRNIFDDVQKVVYDGMRYVGKATNESLKAFDAKPISLSLSRPHGGHAGGGYAGKPGERGADTIPTWLGRGEAVLNWAHQKVVNSALWNQYGTTLDGLFKGTNALHGGTHGQAGYAGGGYTGPGHSGEGFTPVWNFAKSKFGMTYYTGYDGHNKMTSSGNVSDHWYHRALDMGNGILTAGEDALNAFVKTRMPQVVKQLIWRDKDQFSGYPIGGHQDHVHLAMLDQFAFNASTMARIISRASRGLSIAALLKGAVGGDLDVDHVQKAVVKGVGPLAEFAQKAIDKVRGAANRAIDKAASILLPGADVAGLHGEPYDGPLNRLFPSHGLGDAAGHAQLSPDQVRQLAASVGLPGTTFEQIAHGESNYYPGIISSDGGYGLWQNTPRVWGASALSYLASLGGTQQLLNPYKNALMAKFLYDSAGGSISPWYGTQYVTGHAAGGYADGEGPPEFATGGQVPGSPGSAVPIVAHAGEWVLNAIQQSKLARLLGMGVGQIRDLLGFTGGPSSYQGGGVISPDGMWEWDEVQQRWVPRSAGRATFAMLPSGGGGGPTPPRQDLPHGTPGNVFIGGQKLKPPSRPPPAKPPATQPSTSATSSPTTSTAADAASSAAEAGKKAAEKIAKPFNLLKHRLESIAKGEYEAPAVNPRALAAIEIEIRRVFKAIRNIDGKGKLEKYLKNIGFITDQDGLLDQLGAGVERLAGRLERTMALAQVGLKRVGDRLIKSAKLVDPAEIATITIKNLDRVRDALRDERRVAEKGLEQVDKRLKNLRKGGVTSAEKDKLIELTSARSKFLDTLDDIDGKIAENRSARYQAQLDRFQANLANAERRQELKMQKVDFSERQLAVDEKLGGDRLGFAQRKIGVSDDRTAALRSEGDMLRTFKDRAEKLGDIDAFRDLKDRLKENEMAIKEELASRQELVLAYRQTATDIITGSQERSTGLIGTASGIIQKLGDISGNLDIDKIKGFLQQTADVLSNSAKDIYSNIQSAIGPSGEFGGQAGGVLGSLGAAFQAGPESFATKLAELGPLIATLESTMSETERTAFQALIQSMIDNTVAVVDNTQATADLTDTAVQQWSSTAWQWFREAVFTGTGAILPEYDVPQMQTGGHVTRGGLFRLHTGEFVANAERSNVAEGDTHITIHEAGRPLDVTHLASRLAFEKKSRRR